MQPRCATLCARFKTSTRSGSDASDARAWERPSRRSSDKGDGSPTCRAMGVRSSRPGSQAPPALGTLRELFCALRCCAATSGDQASLSVCVAFDAEEMLGNPETMR